MTGKKLLEFTGQQDWLAPLIIAGYIMAIPLWVWIAKKNPQTREVLLHGWTPVVGAMLISSIGGLILDFMVSRCVKLFFITLCRLVNPNLLSKLLGKLVSIHLQKIDSETYVLLPYIVFAFKIFCL